MKLFINLIIGLVVLSVLVMLLSTDQQRQRMVQRSRALIGMPPIVIGKRMAVEQKKLKPKLKNRSLIQSGHALRCGRVKSTPVNNFYTMYEWKDINGRMQASDKRPTANYSKLHVKNLRVDNFFKLSIDGSQARLPAYTSSQIQTGVKKIYKTLSNIINVAEIRTTKLKLKFIADKQRFHQYRKQVASDTSANATGFYTDRLNEATIWAVGDRKHITRISLHESTHAIVAAMFGGAPVWLNEGLASFFENTVITGKDIYSYELNSEYLKLLHRTRLSSLNDHFSQARQQWYDINNSDLNYAVDWSLVFYMMRTPQGRSLLRYMLDRLAVVDCQGFDTVNFINQFYPGGLRAFESGWRHWLSAAKPGVMTISGM
ncbi:MAG: hypothetical protein COB22_05665 [Cycloclasticus sp.]|nr:MAG: hypothetical protein COB22_05665 [Cycloclasticus sp.]